MHLVEELCDRIVLIDHGKVLLYGKVAEVRRQFAGNALLVQVQGELPELPGVESREAVNGGFKLHLAPGRQPQDILRQLVEKNIIVERFEQAVPTLDEIFIRVVQGQGGEE